MFRQCKKTFLCVHSANFLLHYEKHPNDKYTTFATDFKHF